MKLKMKMPDGSHKTFSEMVAWQEERKQKRDDWIVEFFISFGVASLAVLVVWILLKMLLPVLPWLFVL